MQFVRNIIRRWNDFFYKPTPPQNLCISRFFFFGYLFYLYWGRATSGWAEISSIFWMPISFFKLNIPVLSEQTLAILDVA